MQNVIADITTSVDGYVMGPGESIGHLHDWVFAGEETGSDPRSSATGIDAEILTDSFETRGAVVMGRRTYDVTNGWGGEPPFQVPCFVLTSRRHERVECENGATFEFVMDGATAAITRARAAAGSYDVSVVGGAATIRSLLDAGHHRCSWFTEAGNAFHSTVWGSERRHATRRVTRISCPNAPSTAEYGGNDHYLT